MQVKLLLPHSHHYNKLRPPLTRNSSESTTLPNPHLFSPLTAKTTMETIKQGVNYVAETVQGAASGASKEANKEIAKDSNVGIGTR